MDTYPCSGECPNVELPFATDIKQSTFIGNRHSKPCKNQGCCVKEHITEIVNARKCTHKDDVVKLEGTLPAYLEYNATQEKKTREGEEGR